MTRVLLGVLCGAGFGIVAAGVMLPMKFETFKKKSEAILAAFLERFMIGLVIPLVVFAGLPAPVIGGVVGLGFSLPTSIITRAYLPINAIGLAGGVLVGVITMLVFP